MQFEERTTGHTGFKKDKSGVFLAFSAGSVACARLSPIHASRITIHVPFPVLPVSPVVNLFLPQADLGDGILKRVA